MNQGNVSNIGRDHSNREARRHVIISHIHVASITTTDTIMGNSDGRPMIDMASVHPSNSHHAHEHELKNRRACPRSLEAV